MSLADKKLGRRKTSFVSYAGHSTQKFRQTALIVSRFQISLTWKSRSTFVFAAYQQVHEPAYYTIQMIRKSVYAKRFKFKWIPDSPQLRNAKQNSTITARSLIIVDRRTFESSFELFSHLSIACWIFEFIRTKVNNNKEAAFRIPSRLWRNLCTHGTSFDRSTNMEKELKFSYTNRQSDVCVSSNIRASSPGGFNVLVVFRFISSFALFLLLVRSLWKTNVYLRNYLRAEGRQ